MKTSNTITPLSKTNWQYYKKSNTEESPKYWVILEEKDESKPQSELMRFRLGAESKRKADKLVEQAQQQFPADIRNQLNIRIEKA